jgi:hypothetical protein
VGTLSVIRQIDDLRFRGSADYQSAIRQTFSLRYESRGGQFRSAGWQPAVSRIGNPRGGGRYGRAAGWQPAIQQIGNRRCG